MTQQDLVQSYTASQMLLADYRQAHARAIAAYKEAAMKVTTPFAEAARLRVVMQRAGQLVLAAEKSAVELRTKLVEKATPQMLDAACEYRKRLSYSQPQKPLKWIQVEYHPVTDFGMPAAAAAGCYYVGGPYLAGAFAVVATLVTTLRVLLRQRKESRGRYDLSVHNAIVNAEWIKEAADKLNALVGTPFAADTLSAAMDRKHSQRELLLADGTVLHNAAEAARAARRQAGLDAWRERQTASTTIASATAVAAAAVGGAMVYAAADVDQELPAALTVPEPLEYYDMPVMESLDIFPQVNVNGMPMVEGTGIDVMGDAYGAPSWP